MTVHTIADNSSLLKHQKMLNMILIQSMSVSNITVIDKYICTLIHNYAVTQHTHIIFAQECHIRISKYVVHIKMCNMKQQTTSYS